MIAQRQMRAALAELSKASVDIGERDRAAREAYNRASAAYVEFLIAEALCDCCDCEAARSFA